MPPGGREKENKSKSGPWLQWIPKSVGGWGWGEASPKATTKLQRKRAALITYSFGSLAVKRQQRRDLESNLRLKGIMGFRIPTLEWEQLCFCWRPSAGFLGPS